LALREAGREKCIEKQNANDETKHDALSKIDRPGPAPARMRWPRQMASIIVERQIVS
jgi:hypothetical protein